MTPGLSFETLTATATVADPEPALRDEVRELYDVLVPYWTNHEVERPLGLTEPPSVAEVGPTARGGPVTTVGAVVVVNVRSEPLVVPASLVATRRK